MSASPTVHPAPDPTVSPNTQSSSSPNANPALSSSNAQLAALLSDAFRELEILRRELSGTKRRAEKAEHLLRGFQASAEAHSPNAAQAQIDDANRLLTAFEERAQRAEIAAEESEARRRVLLESWKQLEQYLIVVELRAADARAGYSRIISEGGGQLTLATIPTSLGAGIGGGIQQINMPPPSGRPGHTSRRSRDLAPTFAALPPPPNPNPAGGNRRHRTPSLDSYAGHPPSKRVRGDSDDRGREIRPTYSESHVHAMQQQLADRDYQLQMQQQHQMHARLGASVPRMILSATERKRKRGPNSRSSSRNSNSSYDVEEELIRASGADDQHLQQNGSIHLGNGNPSFSAPSSPHPENHQTLAVPRYRSSKRREDSRPRSSNSMHSLPSHSTGYPVSMTHPIRESPPYPGGTPTRNSRGSTSTTAADAGPLAQPGQVQTYQTHVFAPVVTGAPTKKPKFPSGAGVGSGGQTGPAQSAGQGSPGGPAEAPATVTPAPQVFPAQNAQGQRICRQCGLVGRYKDGKCVEKWGPGPMGPGTVCDRCRKKMKRVERRGTLENQQLNSSASIGGVSARTSHAQLSQLQHSQGSQSSIQRSDTMPAHSASRRGLDREESSITANQSSLRTAVNNSSKGNSSRPAAPPAVAVRGLPSPPPVIVSLERHDEDVPTSNVGRGAAAAAAARLEPSSRSQSRPSSRNNDRNTQTRTPVARSTRPTPPAISEPGTNGNGPKKSPLSHVAGAVSVSPTANPMEVDETDADADADAEAEAEIVDAVEFDGEHDGEGEEDAEAELLEAVDAAEANSSSSQVA